MDLTSITTIIGSYGFPIVACCAMAWYVKNRDDKHAAQLDSMEEKHKSELTDLKSALENNTTAIQKLCDFLTMKGTTNG